MIHTLLQEPDVTFFYFSSASYVEHTYNVIIHCLNKHVKRVRHSDPPTPPPIRSTPTADRTEALLLLRHHAGRTRTARARDRSHQPHQPQLRNTVPQLPTPAALPLSAPRVPATRRPCSRTTPRAVQPSMSTRQRHDGARAGDPAPAYVTARRRDMRTAGVANEFPGPHLLSSNARGNPIRHGSGGRRTERRTRRPRRRTLANPVRHGSRG